MNAPHLENAGGRPEDEDSEDDRADRSRGLIVGRPALRQHKGREKGRVEFVRGRERQRERQRQRQRGTERGTGEREGETHLDLREPDQAPGNEHGQRLKEVAQCVDVSGADIQILFFLETSRVAVRVSVYFDRTP